MKIIRGIFYILLFYFLGEIISHLIYGFIPGSIIGMVLLFLSLYYKKVNVQDVEGVSDAFTRNMTVFFIPAGACLLEEPDRLSHFWLSIVIVCSLSSFLVILVVGLIQEKIEKHSKSK